MTMLDFAVEEAATVVARSDLVLVLSWLSIVIFGLSAFVAKIIWSILDDARKTRDALIKSVENQSQFMERWEDHRQEIHAKLDGLMGRKS